MSKHTPGPWVHWANTNLVIRLHSGAARSEDLRICEVSTNTMNDEGRHNARLIAAAPDLLKALEELYAICHGNVIATQMDQARAAIAAAKEQA